MKIQENSSLRSIFELEEVVMEEDLFLGRIERKEKKKREKMKRKSEGRREKWPATLGGAHFLLLSQLYMIESI